MMITKEQFNLLLSVTTVYSAFAQIYSTLEEIPLDELPDELKEDSVKLFHAVEDILELYNDYIRHTVETSGLPD